MKGRTYCVAALLSFCFWRNAARTVMAEGCLRSAAVATSCDGSSGCSSLRWNQLCQNFSDFDIMATSVIPYHLKRAALKKPRGHCPPGFSLIPEGRHADALLTRNVRTTPGFSTPV